MTTGIRYSLGQLLRGWPVQVIPAINPGRVACHLLTVQRQASLYPAYGLHPMFLSSHRDSDIEKLDSWLQSEPAVAVGECGLDLFIDNPDRPRQEKLFTMQLELAASHRLPVIIHARKSVEEVIGILRRYPQVGGVLHSYSGSQQQARRLIDMGFILGFGGPVTHPRARRLHKLVAELPLEALLLESDAPDQPDAAHRGERNEPAYLGNVLETIARLRGISGDHLAAATSDNAQRLFGIPPVIRQPQ